MFAIASLAVVLCSAKLVLAHGGVLSYSISGNWYQGVAPYNTLNGQVSIQRPWYTLCVSIQNESTSKCVDVADEHLFISDPILNSEAATLACNNAGESLTGAAQLTATVKAGSAITAYWNAWGHPTGPMLTYLAQCPGSSCSGVDSTTLKWVSVLPHLS